MDIIENVGAKKPSSNKKKAGILAGIGAAGVVGLLSLSLVSAPTIETINLSGTIPSGGKVAGNMESSDAMIGVPWQSHNYLATDSLSKESGRGNVYRVVSNSSAETVLSKLASAFDVKGEKLDMNELYGIKDESSNLSYGIVIEYPQEDIARGEVSVGSDGEKSVTVVETTNGVDWTKPSLSVWQANNQAVSSWYYNSGNIFEKSNTSETDAKKLAEGILANLGYDVNSFKFSTYKSAWSTSVYASLLVGGEATAISFNFEFQGDSELTSAYGQDFKLIELGETSLISAYDSAKNRANDYRYYGQPYYEFSGVFGLAAYADSAKSSVFTTEPSSPSVSIDAPEVTVNGDEPVVISDYEGSDPFIPIEEPQDIETINIKLIKSELVWLLVYDNNGVGYLVKGYTLSDGKDVSVSVIAVPDDMLNLPPKN